MSSDHVHAGAVAVLKKVLCLVSWTRQYIPRPVSVAQADISPRAVFADSLAPRLVDFLVQQDPSCQRTQNAQGSVLSVLRDAISYGTFFPWFTPPAHLHNLDCDELD